MNSLSHSLKVVSAKKAAVMLMTTILIFLAAADAQEQRPSFTHADTLRGSITPQRAWWDVSFYDLHVKLNLSDSTISGYNRITYKVLKPGKEMQIDLMTPLGIDSIIQDGLPLHYVRDGNAFFVRLVKSQKKGQHNTVSVYYQGKPRISTNPPWSGGFIWTRDSLGNPWVSTACQTVGASIWWPCKDIEADEPDSQRISVNVPGDLTDISNGRLRRKILHADGTTTYEWFVENPINNYDVSINAGKYAHYEDSYAGEQGELTLDFWPLQYNLGRARIQFSQVKPMLKCFEHWFGPYPWYRDGYKLIEAPYNGMEHQSAVTYGNKYENGYRGRDVSGTGWGFKFDFIIVHESAHEWFGNNITYRDIADMWIHESFANYAENLFVESLFGKEAGAEYLRGTRHVKNDRPIIGHYGVHEEGSGDMYNKGGNMLHTLRQIIGDDEKWRQVLRGLNKTFWHQTVTGKQVTDYISKASGIDFSRVFQQYLDTTEIPVLEYKSDRHELFYRWTHVVAGFDMPVSVMLSPGHFQKIYPGTQWKKTPIDWPAPADLTVDPNYFILVTRVAL